MKIRMNGELRGTPEVRVIASDGEPLGVMSLAKALRLAMKEGLDLVEVNPTVTPPVCKLLDYAEHTHAERKRAADGMPKDKDDPGIALEPSEAKDAAIVWTPFECDGSAFEYLFFPSKTKTRPHGWPAHKAAPGPWVPDVIVMVRKPGDETGAGGAMIFREGTVITTEHAIETARAFWSTLTS